MQPFWISTALTLMAAVVFGSFTRSFCPGNCTCSPNTISCAEKRLHTIATNYTIPKNITKLDYSGNKLLELDIQSLNIRGIETIKEIYLNDSNVELVNIHTFNKCTKLENLDLSENILETIPNRIIQENKQIKQLNLAKNMFRKTPELISTSLEVLDLTDCHIYTFNERNVINLPALKVLYLQENSLQAIAANTFLLSHALLRVELSYNPWKCTCDTAKMFHLLFKSGVLDVEEAVRCRMMKKRFETLVSKEGGVYFKKYCVNDTVGELDKLLPMIKSQLLEKNLTVAVKNDNVRSDGVKDHITVVSVVLVSVLLVVCSVVVLYCYVRHRKKRHANNGIHFELLHTQ